MKERDMAKDNFRVDTGIKIVPNASPILTSDGDIAYDKNDDKLKVVLDGTVEEVVTTDGTLGDVVFTDATQTLTHKTIDGDDNTLVDISLGSLKTEPTDANKFLERDAVGDVVSGKSVPTGDVVGTTDTQTLTSKTLDSPTINNATLSLDDVGTNFSLNLGSVSALTANKTLTLDVNDANRSVDMSGNLTVSGNADVSGTNTGDVTLGTFGSTPNGNGASLSGQILTLQPADGSNPGGVSTSAQTLGGLKTLANGLALTQSLVTPSGSSFELPLPTTSFVSLDGGFLTLTSIVAGVQGQVLILKNDSGGSYTLKNQDGSVTAANRVITGTGGDLTVANTATVLLVYDTTASRWQVIGGSGALKIGTFDNTANGFGLKYVNGDLSLVAASEASPGALSIYAQNIGGIKTFKDGVAIEDKTQIDGQLAYGQDSVTSSGADYDMSAPAYPSIDFQGTATGLRSIVAGEYGQVLILRNSTAGTVIVANQSGSAPSAADRICTGTGADIPLAVNGALFLMYDGYSQMWQVIGGAGGLAVSDTNSIDLTLNTGTLSADLKLSAAAASAGNINAPTNIETDGLHVQVPIATNAVSGVVSTTAQDFAGVKTFEAEVVAEKGIVVPPLVTSSVIANIAYSPYFRCDGTQPIITSVNKPTSNANGAKLLIENFSDDILYIFNMYQGVTTGSPFGLINFSTPEDSVAGDPMSLQLLPRESITFVYNEPDEIWEQLALNKANPLQRTPNVQGNYFAAPFAETADRVTLYRDGTSATPTDGVGGTVPGGFTFATSDTNPLQGVESFLLTKPASDCQGTGVNLEGIVLESNDLGRILQYSFDYQQVSGTYSYGSGVYSDLIMYLTYFNGSSVVPLPPSLIKLDGGAVGQRYTATTTFQVPMDAVTIYPLIHVATSSASAYSFKIDNMYLGRPVGPLPALSGDVGCTVTRATSNQSIAHNTTTTLLFNEINTSRGGIDYNAATGVFTIKESGWYNLSGNIYFSGTTSTADFNLFSVMGGLAKQYVIKKDSSSVPTNPGISISRTAYLNVGANVYVTVVQQTGGAVDLLSSATMPGGSSVSLVKVSAPASVSSGAVVAFSAYSFALSIPNNSLTTVSGYGSMMSNKGGAFNPTTGQFVVPVSGTYRFSGMCQWVGNATNTRELHIYQNATDRAFDIFATSPNAASFSQTVTTILDCVAGDVITMRVYQNSGGALNISGGNPNGTIFSGELLSAAAASVAPNVTVACKYLNGSSQSINNNSPTAITGWTKVYDTGIFNPSTGIFTAPVSGLYEFQGSLALGGSANVAGTELSMLAGTSNIATYLMPSNSPGSTTIVTTGTTTLNLLAGATVAINAFQNSGGSRSISSVSNYTFICIRKVGNYVS